MSKRILVVEDQEDNRQIIRVTSAARARILAGASISKTFIN
jgi:CheY-like chemotaxis protein